MANSKIRVSDLDFDEIKTNLKEFMKGQSEFTDYDFEGSALNVLLDVLAYNTHYNALYLNMAVNEMFLDSASKRNSIISIANNYSYLPISRRSAVARLSMRVPQGTAVEQTISMPRFTPFTASVLNTEYTFYTIREQIGSLLNNQYIFPEFDIYEGSPVVEKFTALENSKYYLRNQYIDTSTIRVFVQQTAESISADEYMYSETIVGLNSTSKVFFIREIEDQKYEISFGKNNLGYEPSIGSIITVEYISTNGSDANNLNLFAYKGGTFPGGMKPFLTLISASTGGRDIETNDEIRYNVSRQFRTQGRAVTAQDYVDIIKANYSDIDSINCWGGEDMIPAQYGKVFISIKPKSGLFLTPPEKSTILESILKPRTVIGVYPELYDPVYTTLQLDTTVYYNQNITTKSVAEITNLVRQTILEFNEINLQKFDGIFRYSNLLTSIDKCDLSIKSNITTVKLRREINILLNTNSKYEIQLFNPILTTGEATQSIVSNGFYLNDTDILYYIDDDGVGNMRLFSYDPFTLEKVFLNENFGTVNYDTGYIVINDLYVSRLNESTLELIITPRYNDVISYQNQIVNIDTRYLKITTIPEIEGIKRTFA